MEAYLYPIDVVYLKNDDFPVSPALAFEIFWVSDGSLTIQEYHTGHNKYTERTLHKNDLYILNPFALYRVQACEYEAVHFLIRPDHFKESISGMFPDKFRFNGADTLMAETLKKHLAQYTECYFKANDGARFLSEALALQIMMDLIRNYSSSEKAMPSLEKTEKEEKVISICRYIEANYKNELSLEGIARDFFLSQQYLARIFKEILGLTVFDYINQIRLFHAENLLYNRRLSIEKISEQCGFANVRSFTHQFQKIHQLSPGEYRNAVLTTLPDTSPEPLGSTVQALIENYLQKDLLSIPEFPEPIPRYTLPVLDLSENGTPWKKNYLKTLCGSDAYHLLYENYQNQVRKLQKSFQFRYFRIQNLLSDAMQVYYETPSGEGHVNFTMVDTVLDFLQSVNLSPYIILSEMPELFFRKDTSSKSLDYPKLVSFLKQFLDHAQMRYGKSYLDSWKISCGFHLNVKNWPYYSTLEDLTAFYQRTSECIRSFNPKIRIGSPWFLDNQDQKDSTLFLFLAEANRLHVMPDYITFSYLPVVFQEAFAFIHTKQIFLEDPNAVQKHFKQIMHRIRRKELSLPKLDLVSWNLSLGNNLLNDTLYRAVYTLKNILDNYNQSVEFCVESVSDQIGGNPTDVPFFPGGIGLFTQQTIRKPVYYMYQMLSRLGSSYVNSGENYFITRTDNAFQIILYNYVHYKNERSTENTFDMFYQSRYLSFSNAKKIEITIPIHCDFAEGFYLVENILNRQHGSAYDIWAQSGFLPLENPESQDFIKAVSVPAIVNYSEKFKDHTYQLVRTLEPLEIRLIQITPR